MRCVVAVNSRSSDHIGIAVKDTCIQPIYTVKESKKKRKRQESDGEEKKAAPKPTGYT